METIDRAGDWRRLAQRYRDMSEEELVALARRTAELTDIAQQALTYVLSERRLKIVPEQSPAPPHRVPPQDSIYGDDRELVEICTVWSLADALQLQRVLDRAGVPFYMGPEKATGVDAVTSNFSGGLSVKVMKIATSWLPQIMQNYTPADDPVKDEERGDAFVRCPKCSSTEVVFKNLITDTATDNTPSRYEWTCDSCGHNWQDEGIAKE